VTGPFVCDNLQGTRLVRLPSILLPTALGLLAVAGCCLPDDTEQSAAPVRIGPGVTPPKLIYREEPEYPPEARQAGIQGTVVFEVVVDVTGKLTNISVISPLGFGLDEKAQEAIERWRFVPGLKDGKPVNVLATIEVNFRLGGRNFDSRTEDRRMHFNVALAGLRSHDEKRRKQAVKTLEDQAKHDFPPAMYVLGKLLEAGDIIAPDAQRGEQLIRKAAKKHHAPALFDLGSAYCEGRGVAKDTAKGVHMIGDAARLGSYSAQFYLGNYFSQDASRDLDRARRNFRLCAATGHAECQLRLGKLLLSGAERRERDYVQAVAWLELAADQGQPEAGKLVENEISRLSPEQVSAVHRLKSQIAHKP